MTTIPFIVTVAADHRNLGGVGIEAAIANLFSANGAPMAVPEILATIKKQKLVKTKAANFDGVLRQTIYKSSKIKRVGRGVYRV